MTNGRCVPSNRASAFHPANRTGSSWIGSCPPSGPSSRRSSTWWPENDRRRAPCGTHRRGTTLVIDHTTSRPQQKIAGAPISWGVCEVSGWGYQLRPDRVLKEMREVGLSATELGPEGFLPSEPTAMANILSQHGLQAVGGFTPLVLHVP